MNRKRAVWLVLVLALAISTAAPIPTGAQGAIRVFVDGQPVNFDVPPSVIQGRVLVPLRGIFERLGATVDYDTRYGNPDRFIEGVYRSLSPRK